MTQSVLDFYISSQLDQIQCPILIIGSEGDRVLDVEASKEIASKTNGELYIYDASFGHGVYDEAGVYKDRILTFLRK